MELKHGYLGQGRNVQKNSSFILCSMPKLGHNFTYPLNAFEDNMESKNIGEYQEFNLIVKSYDGYQNLAGPYKASTIKKYLPRLMAAEEEGRRGANDKDSYVKNIMGTSNMKSLMKLMESDNRDSIIQFQ
ncbi:MAG: hypothetical protein HY833_03585 [Candidatus Aenigmarchaeota archaeon]|nr:hypothetical protein [Candidatus Aenigmarchaeota archaeon]